MKLVSMCVVTAVLAAVAPAVRADPAPPEKTGLEIGKKAPSFTLKDQAGKERTLDEFLKGDGKVALVFYRSASW
jgi:cytochrome oxidase Cu insertion factor (SCO1/SenC/PrrC family)